MQASCWFWAGLAQLCGPLSCDVEVVFQNRSFEVGLSSEICNFYWMAPHGSWPFLVVIRWCVVVVVCNWEEGALGDWEVAQVMLRRQLTNRGVTPGDPALGRAIRWVGCP